MKRQVGAGVPTIGGSQLRIPSLKLDVISKNVQAQKYNHFRNKSNQLIAKNFECVSSSSSSEDEVQPCKSIQQPYSLKEGSDSHQVSANAYENLLSTWRSLESNLKSTRREHGDDGLKSKILELSQQITQLMESQKVNEQLRNEEEAESKSKVLDLIANLEAKHLKLSEENKQLLQDALLAGTSTINFGMSSTNLNVLGKTSAGGGFSGTVVGTLPIFLQTLNQIVKEQDNEVEKHLECDIREKEKIISGLEETIQSLQGDIERLKECHKFEKQTLENEIERLKNEAEMSKETMLAQEEQIMTLTVSCQKSGHSSEVLETLLENMTLANLVAGKVAMKPTLMREGLKPRIYANLEEMVKAISQMKNNQRAGQDTSQLRHSTIELFKQQLQVRRSSSQSDLLNGTNKIEEPTPRFILDNQHSTTAAIGQSRRGSQYLEDEPSVVRMMDTSQQQQQQDQVQLGSTSVFQANLSLNRSILPSCKNSKLFTSTLSNIFRKRPQQTESTSDLWAYIFDLEQELLELQGKIARQRDESQLEISVCLGNNEATKNVKNSLESQVEELALDNQLKTQKIAQLERFHSNLMKTVYEYREHKHATENEDQKSAENSFMLNLQGILSPSQYKKMKVYLEEESREQAVQQHPEMPLQTMKFAQTAESYQNAFTSQMINYDQMGIPYDESEEGFQSMIVGMKETRIMNQESKNSTMSFRRLQTFNIETEDANPLGVANASCFNQSNLISPVYGQNRQNSFKEYHPANLSNQQQLFKRGAFARKSQQMLIQDQKMQRQIKEDDSFDRTFDEDQQKSFFNQPSMLADEQCFGYAPVLQGNIVAPGGIGQATNGLDIASQSQFLNTQNNRTLQSFLNMNNSKGTLSNNESSILVQPPSTGGGIFGFRKKLAQNYQSSFQGKSLLSKSTINKSMNQGQATGQLIQHIHENFQSQLQELKNEKVKLIQILNKFLNIPNSGGNSSSVLATGTGALGENGVGDASLTISIDEYLNNTVAQMPSKKFFEDFQLQITHALSKQQLDLQQFNSMQAKLQTDQEHLAAKQEKLEKKRLLFNDKVAKLNQRQEEFTQKMQLQEERERLLDQQEQKLKYRKQAMDEEWRRLDKKRDELKTQEDEIKKEWEKLQSELNQLGQAKQSLKAQKLECKELKSHLDTESKLLQAQREQVESEQVRQEEREVQLKVREKKVEREMERSLRQKEELNQERIEIEKQKEFIKQERGLIEQERQDLEQKRSLSGMFIPDLKNLVTKMSVGGGQATKHYKSLNRTYVNDGTSGTGRGECRIKPTALASQYYSNNNVSSKNLLPSPNHQHQESASVMTNMSAYINKCQCGGGEGIFNCDLHKTMNKSTISLSNICNYHSVNVTTTAAAGPGNSHLSAIGSGRPTYKDHQVSRMLNSSVTNLNNESKFSLSKAFLRDNSFKRGVDQQRPTAAVGGGGGAFGGGNLNTSNISFKQQDASYVQNCNSLIIEESNKENASSMLNSIIKGTAKFKESKFKLEQSYNSLIESLGGGGPQVLGSNRSGMRNPGDNFDMMNSHSSFMSFDSHSDENSGIKPKRGKEEADNGHFLSRDDL